MAVKTPYFILGFWRRAESLIAMPQEIGPLQIERQQPDELQERNF
jgi:hypothetical protein